MVGLASLTDRVLLVAAVLLLATAGGLCAQERVGISSAVGPKATGTPRAVPRNLVIGQDVILN